ncbi:hypothetical protein [Reichenbachiella ulvae]|uniref:Uncharacterized protein n=1 Tax=Reichenbachiella ulvae TaxID=2980104 RepID=A0ABT3CNQ2_9BACT|nr:hypothetical protein [Reichenbachiella ulvae]MCV9385186.1 hypothetical protein [Reichenbachiella ulvae]
MKKFNNQYFRFLRLSSEIPISKPPASIFIFCATHVIGELTLIDSFAIDYIEGAD